MAPPFRRIAIVGGGCAGLAMLKAAVAEPTKFDLIDLYERRDKVGGLWYYGGDKTKVHPPVPSTDPSNTQLYDDDEGYNNRFFSPMYKHLETNITGTMMEYNRVHFPHETPQFPHRDEVYEYIKTYSDTIPDGGTIYTNSEIVSTEKHGEEWVVTVENSITGDKRRKNYDAVVVANGHFDVPYIPLVLGLAQWNRLAGESITHSKYFDEGNAYKGKTVLVVGGFASGIDLAVQIGVSASKVYMSTTDMEKVSPLLMKIVTPIGVVALYNYEDQRSVTTVEGERVEDIDAIVFCTGYLYSVPFLDGEITNGAQIKSVYKQLFNINDPSLTFLALPKFVIPMPLAEAQACAVARYYSGRLTLPTQEEMEKDYEKELEERGSGKAFHNLNFPADVNYCEDLRKWIETSGPEGLFPPVWDEQRVAMRKSTAETKGKRVTVMVDHALKLREKGEDFYICP